MTLQTMTLNLPRPLYNRLRQRAERAQRTVEAEVLEVVATSVSADENLSADLASALAGLGLLNDAELWQAARSHLPPEEADELEELNLKRQWTGLTPGETQRGAELISHYERAMLVRARVAVLLKRRGHDISILKTEYEQARTRA